MRFRAAAISAGLLVWVVFAIVMCFDVLLVSSAYAVFAVSDHVCNVDWLRHCVTLSEYMNPQYASEIEAHSAHELVHAARVRKVIDSKIPYRNILQRILIIALENLELD